MNIMPALIAAGLFVATSSEIAHADGILPSPGETFDISGTGIQTSGANCCSSGTFTGSFTVGSLIPSTTDWTITAFSVEGCNLGINSCSSVVWDFSGLEFDDSNVTLVGNVSAPFTGSGGDSRLFKVTFIDGNTTSDPFSNLDLTRSGNDKFGTISYTVSAVPEPSSGLLLVSVVGLVGFATAWRQRREQPR